MSKEESASSRYSACKFLSKTDNFEYCGLNLSKNGFRAKNGFRDLGLEIQKSNIWIKISILEMLCVSIFRQNGNFLLFRPKFAQKLNLRSEFQNFKFGFGITTSIYHVCQLSVKMENFEFFSLSLEKLPNYMRYFGCNNVESVARAGWRLEWARWR